MPFTDDDLTHLESNGLPALPVAEATGYVETDNARIWYGVFGFGAPVILLHGGLGNAGNFGYQVPALVAAGYRVVAIDSRGQGRSSRDARPYSYHLLAADTLAVMDQLKIEKSPIVGWSDGADTGLVLAKQSPERVAGVFFFACNVDASGTKPFVFTPEIGRIYNHHVKDYAALSPVPAGFEAMRDDLGIMQAGQPNYSADDLRSIAVPVWAVLGERDEFIKPEHMAYIANTLPNAELHVLPEVSHFAPLQRPDAFNDTVLRFLKAIGY